MQQPVERHKLPTLVGILFLIVGLVTGVFLLQQRQYYGLNASGSYDPIDVRISNVTDTGFTVSFYTEKNSLVRVQWSGKQNSGQASQESDNLSTIHFINVTGLESNSDYTFKIYSGDKTYDNQGIPWNIRTSSVNDSESGRYVSGNIFKQNNQAADSSLVYLQIGGAALLSAQTSSNGSFIIPLSKLRDQSLTRNLTVTDDMIINVFVQSGQSGIANAQVSIGAANPLPDMKLGNSYDFTKLEKVEEVELPKAEVFLPQGEDESKFEITDTPLKPKRN